MIATGGRADVRIHFENLTDLRRGEPTYPLLNVVVMTLCAVISGADDFVAIARWSKKNRTWLARYLDLSAGFPSHDRFNADFRRRLIDDTFIGVMKTRIPACDSPAMVF